MALRPQDFVVDVWFLFGSFCYGLEGGLHLFSPKDIEVAISVDASEDGREMLTFLENLAENPKGLVRAELRVFPVDEVKVANSGVVFPVSLGTEVSPLLKRLPDGRAVLRFSDVHAAGIRDTDGWQRFLNLVQTVRAVELGFS